MIMSEPEPVTQNAQPDKIVSVTLYYPAEKAQTDVLSGTLRPSAENSCHYADPGKIPVLRFVLFVCVSRCFAVLIP